MGLHLFPDHMHSVKSSKNEKELKILRIVATAMLFMQSTYWVTYYYGFFMYFDFWITFLVFLFEFFATLSYFFHSLDKAASVLFVIIWPIVGSITAYFISMSTLNILMDEHYYEGVSYLLLLPPTFLFLDYLFNEIDFVRLQYVFTFIAYLPFVIFTIDFVDPYNYYYSGYETLKINLILKVILFIQVFAIAEISRLAKTNPCEEHSDHTHPLL